MIRIDDSDPERIEVWSEPEPGDVCVGRCIGVGASLEEAKAEAASELRADLRQLGTADVVEALSLALRATASKFRHCEPNLGLVIDSIGQFLQNPKEANARLQHEEEQLQALRRTR